MENNITSKSQHLSVPTSNSPNINTNIDDYSLDDLLTLFDINLSSDAEYETVVQDINEKVNKYIDFFDKTKNKEIIKFLENARSTLIGTQNKDMSNMTEGEKLLDLYSGKKDKNNFINIYGRKLTKPEHAQITKLLTIDSRFRKDYNSTISTNFSCFLPYTINNVTEMCLSDLELPATFYPFQDDYENNYFWIKIEYSVGNINSTVYMYIYIESGNYYQETLLEQITASIDTEGLPITITHNINFDNNGGIGDGNGKVTIEYDGSTDTYVISNIELNFNGSKLPSSVDNYNQTHFITVNDGDEVPDVITNYYDIESNIDYKTRLGWMLGFRESFYTGSVSYESEGQIEIIGPRYLYIILDDHNTSSNTNFFTNNENSILNGDIIARISVKAYAFSIQSQNDFSVYSEPRYYFGQVNIDRIDLKIIDEYNRLINLNGMDFSLTLQMKVNNEM